MNIQLSGIGKQFNYKWIFRNLDLQINAGERIGISGHNGSGKSTLIKLLSGYLSQTSGELIYIHDNKKIIREDIFRYIAICAPYIDLINEFTVKEMVHFHSRAANMGKVEEIIEFCYLEESANLHVQDLSSGMLQRLKLGLCLSTPAQIYLLDEPTSNLDKQGINWFRKSMKIVSSDAIFIVASNVEHDFPNDCRMVQLPYVNL
jgi:ABC-type multidrug transport system ATPase subunit